MASMLLLAAGYGLYEAELLNRYGTVWVTDSDPRVSSFRLPQRFQLPRFDDPDCLPVLIESCKRHRIPGLYPTAEICYDWLLANRQALDDAGIVVVFSSHQAVAVCRDKYTLTSRLRRAGLATPDSLLLSDTPDDDLPYPLLLKSRDSTRARFPYQILDGPNDLLYWHMKGLDAIIQPYITGLPEVSLHMLVGWDGKLKLYVPLLHEQTSTRGMTWTFRTIRDERIEPLCHRLVEAIPGLVGPINVDLFLPDEGEPIVLDINTRFSEYAIGAVLATDFPSAPVWQPYFAEAMFMLARRERPSASFLGQYRLIRIQSTVQRYVDFA